MSFTEQQMLVKLTDRKSYRLPNWPKFDSLRKQLFFLPTNCSHLSLMAFVYINSFVLQIYLWQYLLNVLSFSCTYLGTCCWPIMSPTLHVRRE